MTTTASGFDLLRAHPLPMPASAVSLLVVGDLTGDGTLDTVVKHGRDGRVALTATAHDGRTLWDYDTGLPAKSGWHQHHCPLLCWDVDLDGNTEVVLHDAGDAWGPGSPDVYDVGMPTGERLVVLDGATGEVKRHCPWPACKSRVMMTVAHLDGRDQPASLVIVDETYGNEVITVIDAPALTIRWRKLQGRAAGHNVDVADVDGDGKQEIIVGGVCYRGDGSVLWEAERFGHTDVTKPAKIDPDLPGLQTWVLVENTNPGVYLLGHDGKTLWHEPYGHAHFGWIGKQTHDVPGLQPHAAEDGRVEAKREETGHFPIYHRDGSRWYTLTERQRKAFMPVAWVGDGLTDFIDRKAKRIVRLSADGRETLLAEMPAGFRFGRNLVCYAEGDDPRESIITVDEDKNELVAVRCPAAPPEPASGYPIPKQSFAYRHDRSQTGSGYYIYCAYHAGWDLT